MKKKYFLVNMTAVAYVKGSIRVEASTQEEAEKIAKDKAGDVSWTYDGIDDYKDDSPSVSSVEVD